MQKAAGVSKSYESKLSPFDQVYLYWRRATATPSTTWQKPSPTSTSGDEATKGETTQNCHDGGTGTNSNRYARKKSGLKPIRPASISASNLNPTTPGRLPQTPRLNFKENEPRYGMHDFPSTPKYFFFSFQ